MSIIEYTGPSSPQDIRKYLMRRTKDEIVWEYLRLWREYGELEKEHHALAAYAEAGKHIVHGWGSGEFGDVAAAVQLDQWARTQPALCLARLKAEWQADLLDFLESRIKPLHQADNGVKGEGYNMALDDCLACIDMARRQADGGE